MDGRIGHLHCRYRLIGARGSAGVVTARLDRLAQERVAEALEDALDQALGEDPTVYVLRQVEARLALGVGGVPTDARLAQRWGERLAGAVVHSIAHDPNDGINLVRFADQADYVAHFVTDLLRGKAWSPWFYGAFAPLRSRSTGDALRTALLDNREHLPAILSYLHRYDALELLLAALDAATLRLLWSHGLGAYISPDPEPVRPLFAGALRLMDRLELWARARPAGEALFQAYVANGPPQGDWRDRSGLAAAVLDILRFLADRGYLRRSDGVQDEAFLSRLDQALKDFDWLDADWLRTSLLDLLGGPGSRETDLPVRPVGHGPTPRQRELLADLAVLLRDGGVRLDRSQPDSPANALRLYALLVAHHPGWAGDPMVTGVIQRLLGEPSLGLAGSLVDGESQALVAADMGIETGCAGLFLLLRAILDARLPLLVEGAGYPSQGMRYPEPCPLGLSLGTKPEPHRRAVEGPTRLGAALIALGLRWAGEPGIINGQIDAGLSLWAGLENPPTLETLHEIWSNTGPADHARFQAALLRILAGQRLVRGSLLHLYRVPVGGGNTALVAGDETAGLWPLGRVIETIAEVVGIVTEWLDVWEEATGCRPTIVVGDESLLAALQRDPGVPDVVVVPETGLSGLSDSSDELATTHRAGREALLAALEALDDGRLGVPEADLTTALAAVVLLHVWARWLRQFAASSVPYLLTNFIRRPGRVYTDANSILVEMEPRPLDVVIHMAGYTAELERVPWLGHRRVRFQPRGT
jgi:hypothetical protein